MMLKALRDFLQSSFAQPDLEAGAEADEHSLRMAIAALLVEMSRADFVENEAEQDKLRELLAQHFSLEQAEAEMEQRFAQAAQLEQELNGLRKAARSDMRGYFGFLAKLSPKRAADMEVGPCRQWPRYQRSGYPQNR